jgi:hypothetical protein
VDSAGQINQQDEHKPLNQTYQSNQTQPNQPQSTIQEKPDRQSDG